MLKSTEKKNCKPFEYILKESPIIIMMPHSGRNYEKKFLNQTNLSINSLRDSEDAYVDKIFFSSLSNFSYIKANFPRIFVDVNRSPLEIDPLMWEDTSLKKLFNQRTSKVLSGIGVFPKVNLNGTYIYNCKLPFKEAKRRLLYYYFPYHKKIKEIINISKTKFEKIIALDCHSMSSEIVSSNIDIVLSNGEGKTACHEILYLIEECFTEFGFKVKINDPFKGGFISFFHSNLERNINVVQIEIKKNVYMTEDNFVIKKDKMEKLKRCFKTLIRVIS